MMQAMNDRRKRESDVEMRIARNKKTRAALLKKRRNIRDRIIRASIDLKATEFDLEANNAINLDLLKERKSDEPVDEDGNFM